MEENLTLQGYNWISEDLDENFIIRGWCFNRDSIPHLIRIENFFTFAYVELPTYIRNKKQDWTSNWAHTIYTRLKSLLEKENVEPIGYEFKMMEKLYYYVDNKKFPMLLISFKKMEHLKILEKVCRQGLYFPYLGSHEKIKINLQVWETKIDIIRKFFTLRNCGYSQWFSCKGKKVSNSLEKMSTLENEFIVDYTTLDPISQDQSQGWFTQPTILAFDLECHSANHKAFPNKYSYKDVIYMCSCLYQRAGQPETLKKYVIIFGHCNDVKDVEIIRVNSEMELIEKWCDLVKKLDPDLILGYNILGFDYSYMETKLNSNLEKWKNCSRMLNDEYYTPKMKTMNWKSSAYSHNDFHILQIEGRINIDLLQVVKKSGVKLDSYSLDNVSKYYLKKQKHDVKAEEMFAIYDRSLQFSSFHKTQIKKEEQTNQIETKKIETQIKKEEQTNQIETKKEKEKKALDDMTRIVEYCVQDSILVVELFDYLLVWIGLIEMSNVVGVNMVDLLTRGQQIRCFSLIYHYAATQGKIIDERQNSFMNFEGGFVQEPIPGLYDHIFVFDFASLYPSIIDAFNICYTTLIPQENMEKYSNENVNHFKIPPTNPQDTEKHFQFVKSNVKRGLAPQIVRNLVEARKKARAQIKETKIDIERQILDQRQLALKTTANSMFGFFGVSEGKLPLIEAAMCITARGREMIQNVNQYLKEKYDAKIIYNDTDSSMVDLGITDKKICYELGLKLAEEISLLYPPPIKIEFEKCMRMLSFMKKKYAAFLMDKKGEINVNDPKSLMVKGILPARRDNCQFVRNMYLDLLKMVLQRKKIEEVFDKIVFYIDRLIKGDYDTKDLVIIRSMGKNYKSESYIMNVFLQELIRIGKPVQPGDRVDYVIIKNEKEDLLGKKMRTLEWFYESKEKIDIDYYIEKSLQNPIDQLFYVAYKSILDFLVEKKCGYYPSGNKKFIFIKNPVKMISNMIKDGHDISTLTQWFRNFIQKTMTITTYL